MIKAGREFLTLVFYLVAMLFEWLSDLSHDLADYCDPEMDKARRKHDEAMRHIKQRLN